MDRLELTATDITPAGARTYPLLRPPGLEFVAVHGQELDGVGHVLVTGPAGEAVTQASARVQGTRDRALLVLSTLILAAGRVNDPTRLLEQTLADRVLAELGGEGWTAPGWSRDVVDPSGRVMRTLRV